MSPQITVKEISDQTHTSISSETGFSFIYLVPRFLPSITFPAISSPPRPGPISIFGPTGPNSSNLIPSETV